MGDLTYTKSGQRIGQPVYGPWRYDRSDYDGEFVITGSNAGGGSILPVLGRTHNFPHNAEANARLIAAAPDLLAAVEALLPEDWRDGVMDHMPGVKLAREALAKARGVDPRDPDPSRPAPFNDHNCARCKDGARACDGHPSGNPRNCEYLHARND